MCMQCLTDMLSLDLSPIETDESLEFTFFVGVARVASYQYEPGDILVGIINDPTFCLDGELSEARLHRSAELGSEEYFEEEEEKLCQYFRLDDVDAFPDVIRQIAELYDIPYDPDDRAEWACQFPYRNPEDMVEEDTLRSMPYDYSVEHISPSEDGYVLTRFDRQDGDGLRLTCPWDPDTEDLPSADDFEVEEVVWESDDLKNPEG